MEHGTRSAILYLPLLLSPVEGRVSPAQAEPAEACPELRRRAVALTSTNTNKGMIWGRPTGPVPSDRGFQRLRAASLLRRIREQRERG